MKKTMLTFVAMIIYIATSMAQTLYEVKYYDIIDQQTYKGLFFYTDDDNCFLRCINKENQYWERNYYCQYEKADGVNYLYFLPQPNESEDEPVFPAFCMAYSTSGEFEPTTWAICQDVYEEEELRDENMKEVDYFREVELAEKDEDYFLQFYDETDEMFKTIMKAKKQLSDQSDINTNEDNPSVNVNPDNSPASMQLILVAATKDESIGESVETDVKLVRKNFGGIAKLLGIPYKETVIADYDFKKSKIENAIRQLSPGANDVVIFVYSGHGFRFDDDTDAYPRMYLTYDGDLNEQTYLSTTEVYNQLVAKHARLTIFLTDCCNSKAGINRSQVESVAFGTRSSNSNADIEKLRTLFLNESGTIRATAAKAGQYALCDASGGFMLTSILNNIKAQVSALSNANPSWTTIVENASKAVAKKTSNQIDEAGNEQPPQVVVRSVQVKGSPASDNRQSSLSSDYDDYDYDNQNDDSNTGFDWSDLLCILSPVIILILLIVFIIKILKNKNKNKQN